MPFVPSLISTEIPPLSASADASSAAPMREVALAGPGSRPDLAPLLRRRLMLAAALGSGICIAAALLVLLAFAPSPSLPHGFVNPQLQLDLTGLGLNLALLALLWRTSFAERDLRVVEMLLFALNTVLFVAVPFWLYGKEHGDAHTAATIILIRCVFIPGPPRNTLFLCLGIWAIYLLGFALSVPMDTTLLPSGMGRDEFLRVQFLGGNFVIAIYLGIGMAAVWTIHGLRMRAFRAEQAGSYRLLEKLGEGGMGQVYRARHAFLRRPTAVKMLRADLIGSPVALKRFEREVRTASELTDPHTIAIYDFGRTEDGRFYYAMEHLDGLDLQELVERFGPLPPARVVFLLEQVLGSLAEAHRRGLLNRDIKPGNIFLTVRGVHFDFVKVLDFGLVKAVAATGGPADLTGEGSILGSPGYLAPERFYGDQRAGGASDLYAVGAVAYFLLAGRPVFLSRTPMQALVDHVKTPPVPLRELGIELSEALEATILRALAKDPLDRFGTAEEMRDALHRSPEHRCWSDEAAQAWWIRNMPRETREAVERIEPDS
jgi:eukaryotic-like serine/threonine-protein kinase